MRSHNMDYTPDSAQSASTVPSVVSKRTDSDVHVHTHSVGVKAGSNNSSNGHDPAVRLAVVGRQVTAVVASSITPKRTRWLWDGRLPLGELSLLTGREGIGKSTVCYQFAADITRGRLVGEFKGQCRAVIVAATEDSWEHTIVPRLMAADADLSMIYRVDVTAVRSVGRRKDKHLVSTGLLLPEDLDGLKDLITELGAVLVLLDPLISRLDTKLDTHKDSSVRQALEPTAQLAHECSVSILGLIHVNKGVSSDPLNMVMASRAFVGVARAVLYCLVDPDDDTEQRRLIGQAKNNLGRMDLPVLPFHIENAFVCDTDDGPIHTGRVSWAADTLSRGLQELIETGKQGIEQRTATSEAVEWLREYLTAARDPVSSGDVKAEAKKAGHSLDSIKRACKKLSVVVDNTLTFPRKTYWSLH